MFSPDERGIVQLEQFPQRSNPIGKSRYDWIEKYLDGKIYKIPHDIPQFSKVRHPADSFRSAAAKRKRQVRISKGPDSFVVQAIGVLVTDR